MQPSRGQLRRARRPSSCLLLLALGCGAREPAGSPAAEAGARQTIQPLPQLLAEIAQRADPASFPYDNRRRADLAEARARQLPAGPERFRLLVEAALERVRGGQPEAALGLVEAATTLLRESNAPLSRTTAITLLQLRAQAGLRLGENENCVQHHSVDSCLLPIAAGGVHAAPRGSRAAAEALRQLLSLEPGNLGYRWLLNLAAMTLGEYPEGVPAEHRIPPQVFASDGELVRFREVAGARGVGVVALSGGAVMEDFDGDGRLDLMASSWGLADPLRLFRQLGDGSFEERTQAAGLGGQLGGINLVHADCDNDGDADVLVLRGGWLFDHGEIPNSLLRNEGNGTFVDVTEEAGLLSFLPSHTAAWGDYDRDGWLDLFVGNEPSRGQRHPSQLFHANGDGTFEEVSRQVGLVVDGLVKGAVWGDVDGDGLVDLYVSRFGEANLLWRNQGGDRHRWSFADETAAAGVAEPRQSFPVAFFDFDNDGWQDLLVGGFAGFASDSLGDVVGDVLGKPTGAARPRLYRNRGGGRFEDLTMPLGLDRAILSMGANFGDLDNDGWLDLYFGTGEPSLTTLVPNLVFRNDRGERFRDVTTASGMGSIQKGHGVAFGDVDGDGDEDLYVTMGGAYSGDVSPNLLFENPGSGNHWLTLELRGSSSNRAAIGVPVRISVTAPGGPRTIARVVGTGGSFGSSSLALEVGLGAARRVDAVEVRWTVPPRRVAYRDVPMDRFLTLAEALPWAGAGSAAGRP